MCDECTWHHTTFLMQLYWHLVIINYFGVVLFSTMVVGLSSLSPMVQAAVVVVVTTAVVQCVRWLLSYRSYYKFFMSLPGETDFHWVWGNLHKVCSWGWNGEGVDGGVGWDWWWSDMQDRKRKENACLFCITRKLHWVYYREYTPPPLALSPSPPILKYRNATFAGNFGEIYCTEREFKYILKVFAQINANSRYSIKFKYILKVLAEVSETTHVTVSNSSTF